MGYAMGDGGALVLRETAGAAYVEADGPGTAEVPDLDVVEELGDEIATLAAHIHAATHRFLLLIARFDRLRGWEAGGHRTCAHWLSHRTGLDLGTAREHVRVARALEGLPETGRAMSRGRLSFSQVRALTRVAEPGNEADLLELAAGCTTAQLERMVRAWKKGSPKEEAALEEERHRSRKLSVFPDDEGMYVIRGRLDPEVGAVLMRALEAAGYALYRKSRWEEAVEEAAPREAHREAARRRADAMGLLAERALMAAFGEVGEAATSQPEQEEEAPAAEEEDPAAEAPCTDPEPRSSCECAAPEAPISGTRAERYQVVLHVDAATLSAGAEPGRSHLRDGTRVSAETSRRLSCDAALVPFTRAPDGSVLDVGRRRRTIPPALRRALELRDRGCRFPGCGLRFTDAHHVRHWADGGRTSLDNTLLLCRHHHRLVHEGGWRVLWGAEGEDRPAFRDPRGTLHVPGRRTLPELPEDPVAALTRRNRLGGADPDPWTAGARWKRERDIPDRVYFRATGAV